MTGFPAKSSLRKERRNFLLMTRHYPDLGSASDWLNEISHAARPIRSPTKIWVVTRHQYGISALVSQTSFGGETSGSVAKCRLFSQATGHLLSRGFWIAYFPTNQKSGFQNKILLELRFGKFPLGSRFFHLYFACDDFAFEIPSRWLPN